MKIIEPINKADLLKHKQESNLHLALITTKQKKKMKNKKKQSQPNL